MADGTRYDGLTSPELAALLELPAVVAFDSVASTMDAAHSLAGNGALAGTLVLADTQTRGRGRGGRSWTSLPGAGIWMTLIERPHDAAAIEVLSLRIGLRAAGVLDRFAGERVGVKWPNDLMLGDRKLAGILVEARWRDGRPEWTAMGLGVNILAPDGVANAAALGASTSRVEVLRALIPAIRAGAMARGPLDDQELAAFAERDWARGRLARAPSPGIVVGLTPRGGLLVETEAGTETCISGSLVLEGVDA